MIDVDGNTWSSRFSDLLSTGNAVFKQESEYWDWVFPLAQPYKHYIPIKKDLSNLVDAARGTSVEELQAIGEHGFAFYKHFLTPTKQLCYLHLLLMEYTKLAVAASRDEKKATVASHLIKEENIDGR